MPCTSRGSNPDHRCLRPALSPIKVLVLIGRFAQLDVAAASPRSDGRQVADTIGFTNWERKAARPKDTNAHAGIA